MIHLLILTLHVAAAAVQTDDGDEAKRHWKRLARESIQKREEQLRQQVAEASGRLEKNPADVSALVKRGAALQDLDREDEAAKDLQKAVELQPKNFAAWMALGELELGEKRYSAAREAFTTASALDPSSARAFWLRGVAHERDRKAPNRYEQAVADYSAALKLDAGLRGALLDRAGSFEKMDRAPEALADCDRVADLLRGFLQVAYPEILEQLASARKMDGKKYREILEHALEKEEEFRDLQATNPVEFNLVVRLQTLERQTGELGTRLRQLADGSEKEIARGDLRKVLGEVFDLRQLLRSKELDALQRRIDSVRAAMKVQAANKSQTVEQRISELERPAEDDKGGDERRKD